MSGRERYSGGWMCSRWVLILRQDDYFFHATRKLPAIEPVAERARIRQRRSREFLCVSDLLREGVLLSLPPFRLARLEMGCDQR